MFLCLFLPLNIKKWLLLSSKAPGRILLFFQSQIMYFIISKNVWPPVLCNTIICNWKKISLTYTTNSTCFQSILITVLLPSSAKAVASACTQTSSFPPVSVFPSNRSSCWFHVLFLYKDTSPVENILNATTVLFYVFHLLSWSYADCISIYSQTNKQEKRSYGE